MSKANTVTIEGQVISFTNKEAALLSYLHAAEGRVRTPRMIMDHLYKDDPEPSDMKIIDVYICRIRTKLKPVKLQNHLRTVWGRGFAWGTPKKDAEPVAGFDLPSGLERWASSRKRQVLKALDEGLEMDALLAFYPDLSREEIAEWSSPRKAA